MYLLQFRSAGNWLWFSISITVSNTKEGQCWNVLSFLFKKVVFQENSLPLIGQKEIDYLWSTPEWQWHHDCVCPSLSFCLFLCLCKHDDVMHSYLTSSCHTILPCGCNCICWLWAAPELIVIHVIIVCLYIVHCICRTHENAQGMGVGSVSHKHICLLQAAWVEGHTACNTQAECELHPLILLALSIPL